MQEDNFEKEIKKSVEGLKFCGWVKEEFSWSDFEDKRLFLRLLAVANDLSKNPIAPINQASGEWKIAKAAYRFFDNEKVTEDVILKSHILRTKKRVIDHSGIVLAIQDTSFLNYSHMKCSNDLGPIGKNEPCCMGLVLHSEYAVTAEGLPLGFLHQEIWARDKEEAGLSDKTRHLKPIDDKESSKWIDGLKQQARLFGRDNNVVAVCDRECDIYKFFAVAQELNQKFVVRAFHDRCLDGGEKLWQSFDSQPVKFRYNISLPESDEIATLSVKYAKQSFKLSAHKKNLNNSPKSLKNICAVYLYEENPPSHREPISWMLLTNLPIKSAKNAKTVIGYYKQRWKIEILHKIMKSGCSIELTRLETNKRRFPFVALKSIIASRLLLITHYNKILPSEPASSVLTQAEQNALYSIKHNKVVLNASFSVAKAIQWLAELGGYLSRKADPLPGPTHVWRGWQRLQDYTKMFSLMHS